ncbi:MAG: GNAT family N-acetyltransferase [Gemmatimonadetes bacterium]|nr:GNAT family N-acetyltransferase [Gemmatimonadota bacterium]
MKLDPVVLRGVHVRLVPMTREHVPALWQAGRDPELWRWTTSQVHGEDDMRRYVDAALAARADGTALPFVTTEAATGRVAGSTRFANLEAAHRRVEIGWTWIARPWQRTALNTEAKYLMLRHAFEALGCVRVELKTDALNARSRAAILRLGARAEGVLRKHMTTEGGRVRDTVFFSVLDDEWPRVKARLEQLLADPPPARSASPETR